ncbi:E3 ubiquitin-protein ligase Jade-2 [Mactra antiquata]
MTSRVMFKERRSKRRRLNEDEDENDEKERETPVSKAASSKKTPQYSGGASSHKPAELFRKDLISAMKLPDSEPLAQEDYFLIADPWRQEWERGVQVPVNDVSLRSVDLKEVTEKSKLTGDFKMSKKFLHASKDETYQLGQHELTGMSQLSEQVVRYDLDDLDVSWLKQLNEQREEVGDIQIHEWTMERVIEALEAQCHENMEIKKKTEEGLGIEYDEDIVCEICQSPDSEDTNEMVFCDGCDICVHQACYGIQTVPEGSWLCRTCALGIKPACILCPKIGGAMKSTRSGTKWAHVSCAIWIPEVTIGCVEKMEPITKISMIPASRWSLICCICKERNGACIQCSVKSCKTAFHVTCAITDKLEMKTVLIEDKNTEDVKLKAFCPKHSRKRDRNSSESEPDSPRKSNCGTPLKEAQMSEEEKATIRAERLQKLEEEFYNLVKVPEIASQLELSEEIVDHICVFWKLKRRSMFNRPLLTPKTEEADLLEKQQEDSLVARMKMFVHLRQDLERVRNLSYMISRREKIKKQFNIARESVFYATLEVLTDKSLHLGSREINKIIKTFTDLPEPYNKYIAPVAVKPVTPMVVTDELAARQSDLGSQSSNTPVNVENKGKLKSVECVPKEQVSGKQISETPKSRKSRIVSKTLDTGTVESCDKKMDGEESFIDVCDTTDTGTGDDTLVNTSKSSSAVENTTLVATESNLVVDKPEKRKRGRPSLNKQVKDKKLEDEGNSSSDEKVNDDDKIASRKVRTRSSLPEIVSSEKVDFKDLLDVKDIKVEAIDNATESTDTKVKKFDKREKRYSSVTKLAHLEKEYLEAKFPSASKVSNHLKTELSGYLKNNKLVVSNKVRQKVTNALLNGKRQSRYSKNIVIDHSQKKIDTFFVKSPPCDPDSPKSPAKAVSRVLNELSPTRDRHEANSVERSALSNGDMKSDFLARRRSGPSSLCSPSLTSVEKSVDRNRASTPESKTIRTRYDSDSVHSVKDRLFESGSKRTTRSSRESTPESTSSVKSYGSFRSGHQESTRTRTRSSTPMSVTKDSDESESENIFTTSRRARR